jgi:hypothetical protein
MAVSAEQRRALESAQEPVNFDPIPFRIRIGVTGHRRLEDPAAMQSLVKMAIDTEIPRLFPPDSRATIDRVRELGVTPISYRVVTALAEGADRVVARVALEFRGARLDAVLPMTAEDYLEDFEGEESKREFRELLALCRRPVMLRSRNIRDERNESADQAELRKGAYEAAGHYVADHCDVLIAVWDGKPARGKGGTAEIVQYALDQGRPVIRIWDGSSVLLNPESNNGLDAKALEAIDRFNRQPISASQRAEYVRSLDRDLFEKPETARAIPIAIREAVDRCLLPYYAQASIVAKRSQRAFYRAGRSIYLLSAAAVGCAAIGVLWSGLSGYAFGAELLLLIVIAGTLNWARRRHAHQAWVEHRFLAERIRSGIFMAIAGVEPRPIEVLPHMVHSQTVNDWTVRVFNEIWDSLPAFRGTGGMNFERLRDYICEAWIDDQMKFHERKRQSEGRMRRLLASLSSVVLPVTVAAAALHLLLAAWRPDAASMAGMSALREAAHRGLAFVALLFPAVAAALAGMEAHREHLRLEKRHANMVPQLERLKRQMAAAVDPARFEALLHQMDELTLRESQDWLMLMRYVEIKAS